MGPYVLALMFLIGGIVFALLGYFNLVRTRRKRATWLARAGSVVDLAEETDDKGKPLYAPIYRYSTEGREYTAKSTIAARPAHYKVGDSIPVFVNPTKPNDSEVLDGSISLYTYGMMAVGILVLAVGVLVAWLALSGQMKFDQPCGRSPGGNASSGRRFLNGIADPSSLGSKEDAMPTKSTKPTKVNPIPKGMHTVTPNLTIAGCGQAIDFYKRAFGAEELDRFMGPDGKSVWHAALKIGESVIFVNDEIQGMTTPAPGPGRPSPIRLWLYVPDCDAAFKRAVDGGAKSKRQPEDMFWGDRTGAVSDPFGYEWEFATRVKEMTPQEMRRAGEELARKMASGE